MISNSSATSAVLRQATQVDLSAIWHVRYAVQENTLRPGLITDADVIEAIDQTGRGWVIEEDREIKAFAIGNAQTGNIWALFVDPSAQGKGYGSVLHDEMISWLFSQGLETLWLSTGTETRARQFYE